MRLGAVVLAAGQSKRFGSENKLLHLVEGEPLLLRVLGAFEEAGCAELVVVTGHESERIENLVRDKGVRTAFNPDYQEGMGASLACGIRALEGLALDGALVCLGDLPGLRAMHVALVRDVFLENRGGVIVQPCFEGTRGHPVCFPKRCFAALVGLKGDRGARDLIAAEGDRIISVEMESDACIRDLDKS